MSAASRPHGSIAAAVWRTWASGLLWKFGGTQALNESRQTGAWLVVGWATRLVLEVIPSSWGLGHGIAEAIRGRSGSRDNYFIKYIKY